MGILDEAREELRQSAASLKWEEPLVKFDLIGDSQEQKNRLSYIVNTVAKGSPFGKKILQEACDAGYTLEMEHMFGALGACEPENKRILLNPSMPNEDLISTLVHEARHAQQDIRAPWKTERGNSEFSTELKLYRAAEADAQAAAVAACYEIKKNTGNNAPYSASADRDALIVSGFAAKADSSGKVTPAMLRAAFNGWFEDQPIIEEYERSYLVEEMDAIVKSGNFSKMPGGQKISSRQIVETYCTDADGNCYWSTDPDVMEERDKLSVGSKTRKSAEKFYQARFEKTGREPDQTYEDLKVRDGGISARESAGLLKRVFSGEYKQTFFRDLKAEVDFEKEGSLLEKRRLNHIVNNVCQDSRAKKELETLQKAGYSLAMESLGKAVSVRDPKNKVIVLARRASDRELQGALLKEARGVAAVQTAMMHRAANIRG